MEKNTEVKATSAGALKGHVLMIAYTNYRSDARVRREAETLASSGLKVTCLIPQDGGPRQEVISGIALRRLNVRKYQGKSGKAYVLSYLAFLVYSFFACIQIQLKEGVSVVHCHNLPDFLVLAGLVPRLFGKKLILDVHDSVPETYRAKFSHPSPFLFKLFCLEERVSALVSHRVICVNHPQRDVLVGRGIRGSKTFISMNVPDHKIFKPVGEALERDSEKFRLVYHGTMARRLGVDLIIQAAAELRGEIPGLELHLWGHGDDWEGFRDLSESLEMDGMVHFYRKGYPLHELPERLSRMDLGIVGNRRNEATELMLPVKLLEYVSLGIPVVAPRLGCIQYYFSDQMVTFYEPQNVEEMKQGILALYRDRSRAEIQAVQARTFLDRYGWERQGEELTDLYRSLLEGKAS